MKPFCVCKRSNGKAEFSPQSGGQEMLLSLGQVIQLNKHTWRLGVSIRQWCLVPVASAESITWPCRRSDWKWRPGGLVRQRRNKKARENRGRIFGTALKVKELCFVFPQEQYFFFFLVFLPFLEPLLWHMEVPRPEGPRGSDRSCSRWPVPESQQRGIRTASATRTTAHGNA